jgi:hypothetical protein
VNYELRNVNIGKNPTTKGRLSIKDFFESLAIFLETAIFAA